MKDSYLINYDLFCKRRKFILKNFLQNHEIVSYEELRQYFYSLSVEPPSKETFLKTQQRIKELSKEEVINFKETQVETSEEKVKPQPKKRRRRRKSKNDEQ